MVPFGKSGTLIFSRPVYTQLVYKVFVYFYLSMAPTTRSQTAETEDPLAALNHFRCNVMGEANDYGRLHSVFQSLLIESIVEFMILQKEDYEEAVVNDNNDASSKLTKLEV